MFGKIEFFITVIAAVAATWFANEWVVNPLHPDLADGLMMSGPVLLYLMLVVEGVSLIRQQRAHRPRRQKIYFSDRDYDWKKSF